MTIEHDDPSRRRGIYHRQSGRGVLRLNILPRDLVPAPAAVYLLGIGVRAE